MKIHILLYFGVDKFESKAKFFKFEILNLLFRIFSFDCSKIISDSKNRVSKKWAEYETWPCWNCDFWFWKFLISNSIFVFEFVYKEECMLQRVKNIQCDNTRCDLNYYYINLLIIGIDSKGRNKCNTLNIYSSLLLPPGSFVNAFPTFHPLLFDFTLVPWFVKL